MLKQHSNYAYVLALMGISSGLGIVCACLQESQSSQLIAAQQSKARFVEGNQSSAAQSKAEKKEELQADILPAKKGEAPYREPIFVDWEKPDVALLFTGRQHGYIEPCGCTGLINQKGGLLRRYTLIKELRDEKKWPLVLIDAGDQIERFGEQPKIKFSTSVLAISGVMKYDVVGFGPDDLKLPAIDVISAISNATSDNGESTGEFTATNFTAANIAFFGDENSIGQQFFPDHVVINRGGKKIGVMFVIGDEVTVEVKNSDLKFRKVADSIKAVWPKLEKEKCDYNILVAYSSLNDCRELADQFPYFDVIATTGGAGEPASEAEVITFKNHQTNIVQVGAKGMHATVLGFYPGQEVPIRYQRVPLDGRFSDAEEIKKVFVDYQKELEVKGLEGLGIKPEPHPSGRKFVGTEACKDCHEYAYKIWKEGHAEHGDTFGPHSHATASLFEPNERTWVKRYHDPECLSCHVSGWNPQKFFPYQGGYISQESVAMFGNGCENCHGPGSAHVAAENGDEEADEAELKRRQQEMVLTLAEAKESKCMECHDLDNSPDFHVPGAFDEYWKRIDHTEKK